MPRAIGGFLAKQFRLHDFVASTNRGGGIFAVLREPAAPAPMMLAVLGALLTLGLGIHETRTITRCRALIDAGRKMEEELSLGPGGALFRQYPRGATYPYLSTATASVVIYVSVSVLFAWVDAIYAGAAGP